MLRAEAGPDGHVRIERVPPGSLAFLATAARLAARRIEVEVGPRETAVELGDVVLETGLTIRGRVRTSTGAPVSEAQVSGYQRRGGGPVEARSEADGSFTLAGLDEGAYHLWARATGFAPAKPKTVTTGSDGVDLVLLPAGAVTGVVVDERGRPCEAYTVTAHPSKAEDISDTGAQETVASADGRFHLEDLQEETYVLQVVAPDHAPASVSGVQVAAGRTTDAGVIRLARGGVVRGFVADAAGSPVAGATVTLDDPSLEWTGALETSTDPAGAFEIRGVPAGTKTVAASHPDYAGATATVNVDPAAGPGETRLTLTRGGRIEGLVRGRGGAGVAGWQVSAAPLAGPRRLYGLVRSSVQTQADGSFVLDHVRAGPTQVTLYSMKGTGRFTGTIRRVVEVQESETPPAHLILLARLPDGSPAAQARARVEKVGGALVTIFDSSARQSDANGRIEMSVPAGALEIAVWEEKYGGTLRISVGEGEAASAEVVLDKPTDRPR